MKKNNLTGLIAVIGENLDDMVRTCVHRYCAFAVVAKTDEVNLSGLKAFQNEMIDSAKIPNQHCDMI